MATLNTTTRATLRRREFLAMLGVGMILCRPASAMMRVGVPKRLTLWNEHTHESFSGPYRDAYGPIPSAMSDLAEILRDFHADKVGPVHVETLDFLADVIAAVGERRAIVLSAYRTHRTNERLRASMFGVAEKSQHLYGRAVDVALDGNLVDAHEVALHLQRGGVGWYPRSRFIHLDTGPVRSWQMNRAGLKTILVAGHSHHGHIVEAVDEMHPDEPPLLAKRRRMRNWLAERRAHAHAEMMAYRKTP